MLPDRDKWESRDWDSDLARLLAETELADEKSEQHAHIATCPCCRLLVQVAASIRRDLWDIAEGRRPA